MMCITRNPANTFQQSDSVIHIHTYIYRSFLIFSFITFFEYKCLQNIGVYFPVLLVKVLDDYIS